jgi:hypothetical protein
VEEKSSPDVAVTPFREGRKEMASVLGLLR